MPDTSLRIEAEALPDDEMEVFIAEAFEDELDRAEEETGVRANAFARREAFRQILLYWRKHKATAESVRETEVRLVLPNRSSPKGRRFNLEGVVDIIATSSGTMMYDLKTHEPEYVRAHPDDYAAQLDVYATIYEELKGRRIDGTGIISTSLPTRLKDAMNAGDSAAIARELSSWEPLIPLPFSRESRDATIADFGRVVDCIEDGDFSPPPPDRLDEAYAGRGRSFGEKVCQNCDVRFSCSSYRTWRLDGKRVKKDNVLEYFRLAENHEEDEEYRYAAEAHSEDDLPRENS
ncbi:MAG TPA: PD-(D/E)XK nuclease family protein [Rectinemataceae bacterium]|nr:PD-(D/E)XK nuclease family protein [Rectinemataceae bacterium]